MPVQHTYGNDFTAVMYAVDSTSGKPTAVTSVAGAQSVAIAPPQSGGLLIGKLIAAATTNATLLKAAPGQVFGVELANNAAYPVFFKFFNKATLPVPGTDTPVWTIQIPPGGRAEVNRPAGVEFNLGIGYSVTKLVADNDVTVLVAADAVGSVSYK